MNTKPILFSNHAREQMAERGASEEEVIETIRRGERVPAKKGDLDIARIFRIIVYGAGGCMLLNRYWQ